MVSLISPIRTFKLLSVNQGRGTDTHVSQIQKVICQCCVSVVLFPELSIMQPKAEMLTEYV